MVTIILIGLGLIAIVAVFFMMMLAHLANIYRKNLLNRRMKDIDENSQFRKKRDAKPKAEQDFLSKDVVREAKREKELEEMDMNVVPYDPLGQSVGNKNALDDVQIVGMAKPVGMWTKFVSSQKLGFMVARMSLQSNDKGYWVNLIKAQSMSQGKDQSKGR